MVKENEKKSADGKKESNNFLFTQIITVILIILIFLIIRLINKGAFDKMISEYNKYFGKDIPLSAIADNVEGYISDFGEEATTEAEEITDENVENIEEEEKETEEEETTEKKIEETTETPKIKEVSKSDADLSFSEINEMQIPVNGKISSRFGYRVSPITGEYCLHDGIDIAAPMGTAILAALDGEVIASVESESIGYYIKIDHGNGVVTAYGHCSKLIVKEGEKVKKGELIARVGSTGKSTGPHTHFEVRIKGEKVNPAFFMDLSSLNET